MKRRRQDIPPPSISDANPVGFADNKARRERGSLSELDSAINTAVKGAAASLDAPMVC